jgi:hypothetical protein
MARDGLQTLTGIGLTAFLIEEGTSRAVAHCHVGVLETRLDLAHRTAIACVGVWRALLPPGRAELVTVRRGDLLDVGGAAFRVLGVRAGRASTREGKGCPTPGALLLDASPCTQQAVGSLPRRHEGEASRASRPFR